jgi:hypothetical protein
MENIRKRRDKMENEARRQAAEMAECTFQPSLERRRS